MCKNKKLLGAFIIFCLGIVFAFGGITLMKFQDPIKGLLLFVLCLVGMHAGIVAFIVSKKMFKKAGLDAKKYYNEEYFYMAFYIPVLAYKFVVCNIWPNAFMGEVAYMALTLTLTAVLVAFSIRNAIRFAKEINAETVPAYVPNEVKN